METALMVDFELTAPNGPVGVWRGRSYICRTSFKKSSRVLLRPFPGEEAPVDFCPLAGTSGRVKEIDPSELDEWYSIELRFTWRQNPFLVVKVLDDGRLLGELLGADDRWARENGLNVLDRAWVQGTFRVDEVEDLHEERTDLLAQWKERHGG
jgi:hypothetical protein